jgi:hypothetical protein
MAAGQYHPVMLDPSFLVTAEGVEWLENPALRRNLVVPRSVIPWIRGDADWPTEYVVAPDDLNSFSDRRGLIAERLEGIATFSTNEADLSRRAFRVLETLLEEGAQLGELRAEEWAFVMSQSVLLSKLRFPVEAFRDAGVYILEVGRKAGRALLEDVIPRERVEREMGAKIVGLGVAKWVLVGGAHVGGGTLGGLVGFLAGAAPGAFVGGAVGALGAGELAKHGLLVVDP